MTEATLVGIRPYGFVGRLQALDGDAFGLAGPDDALLVRGHALRGFGDPLGDIGGDHDNPVLARLPSGAGCSARMTAVTAYPMTGPSSANSARISEDMLPASRGLTLKVSMAFAMVGLESARRAAIWLDESGTGVPPWNCSYLIFGPGEEIAMPCGPRDDSTPSPYPLPLRGGEGNEDRPNVDLPHFGRALAGTTVMMETKV